MRMLGRVLAPAACALACSLSACGGGSGATQATVRSQSPEEGQVRSAVQELMTSRDPSVCTRLATRRFVEHNTGERGAAAVRSCREPPHDAAAKTVAIDRVQVSGRTAVADVSPSGGELPLVHATLELKKVGPRWKLDRIRGGALDRPAFGRVLQHDLRTGKPPHPTHQVVACVINASARLSDRQVVQQFYVNPAIPTVVGIVLVCQVDEELRQAGASPSFIECADRAGRRAVRGPLRHELSQLRRSVSNAALGQQLGLAIRRACGQQGPPSLELTA